MSAATRYIAQGGPQSINAGLVTRVVCEDIAVTSHPETPGWRFYVPLAAGGYAMQGQSTAGAVVLYDTDRERERLLRVRASTDDEAQRTSDALDALLDIVMERRRRLLSGPNAVHEQRARHLAIAYSDGAYSAVHQLDPVFYLRSGERNRSTYDTLRRAHDLAQPTYERLRDYLADDADVPYLLACLVAARVTDSDKRSPFYGLTTRPVPF